MVNVAIELITLDPDRDSGLRARGYTLARRASIVEPAERWHAYYQRPYFTMREAEADVAAFIDDAARVLRAKWLRACHQDDELLSLPQFF